MNKFVTGALACAVVGSAMNADPVNGDWLGLDDEITALAPSMNATGDYTNLKVLLRGGYIYGKDDLSTGGDPSVSSISGVRLEDVEVNGGTQIGDVKLRLGFDFANSGSADIQDAYAMWDLGEFDVIAGVYKPHLTRSNFTDPENLFFRERSAIGSLYDMWEVGFGFRGTVDALSWSVDVMNGEDMTDGHRYLGRAVWNINRDPGNYETDPEDAFGAGDDFVGTVGFFVELDDDYNRGANTDNYGVDFQGTLGQIGFGCEILQLDDDSGGHMVQDDWYSLDSPLAFNGDSTPWSVFGTYQLDEQFGFGIRIEDLDNGDNGGDDNSIITLGANMYDVGHNGKLGLNLIQIDSEMDDSTIITAGFTFGASR